MSGDKLKEFTSNLKEFARGVHAVMIEKGFWESNRSDAEAIALMHSEACEAYESMKNGDPPDHHCPEFTNTDVELADLAIRILDTCEARKYRAIEAMPLMLQKWTLIWHLPDAEFVCQLHIHLSRILESIRHSHPADPDFPDFTQTETGFARILFWLLDPREPESAEIARAMIAKQAFNLTRPYKHAKAF